MIIDNEFIRNGKVDLRLHSCNVESIIVEGITEIESMSIFIDDYMNGDSLVIQTDTDKELKIKILVILLNSEYREVHLNLKNVTTDLISVKKAGKVLFTNKPTNQPYIISSELFLFEYIKMYEYYVFKDGTTFRVRNKYGLEYEVSNIKDVPKLKDILSQTLVDMI